MYVCDKWFNDNKNTDSTGKNKQVEVSGVENPNHLDCWQCKSCHCFRIKRIKVVFHLKYTT